MPQQQRLQQKWQLDGTKASARSSRNGNWWNGDMTTNEWMSAFMIDVILMKVNCEKVFPTLLQKALPIGLATDFKRLWRNLISNIYFRKSFSLVSHTENFVAEIKWKKFHNCISPCSPSALSLAHIAPSHSHTLSPFSFFLFFFHRFDAVTRPESVKCHVGVGALRRLVVQQAPQADVWKCASTKLIFHLVFASLESASGTYPYFADAWRSSRAAGRVAACPLAAFPRSELQHRRKSIKKLCQPLSSRR